MTAQCAGEESHPTETTKPRHSPQRATKSDEFQERTRYHALEMVKIVGIATMRRHGEPVRRENVDNRFHAARVRVHLPAVIATLQPI